MDDRVLRDHSEPCHHADSRRHPRATGPWKCDLPHCPGGQEVTIDYEAAADKIDELLNELGLVGAVSNFAGKILDAALEV